MVCVCVCVWCVCVFVFFFNDTATTEIYTLSLHDALPISGRQKVILCQPSHMEKTESSHELVDSGFHERSQSDANSVILTPCGDNRGSGYDNHRELILHC